MTESLVWLSAVAAAGAVFILVTRTTPSTLAAAVHDYLVAPLPGDAEVASPHSRDLRFIPWAVGGAVVGLLLAQGDLFLAGAGRSAPALGLLGAAGGWMLWSSRRTTKRQRRAMRLRHELPVVADAIALHAVAGESVASALAAVATQTTGVASEEFAVVLAAHGRGDGLVESLAAAKRSTAHTDAERLYDVLIHAHGTGGRLAASLNELATDLRSAIASDLTSEGGKRAITSYGPVLALMVPTALLFLLYPTLLGLRALSGAP